MDQPRLGDATAMMPVLSHNGTEGCTSASGDPRVQPTGLRAATGAGRFILT